MKKKLLLILIFIGSLSFAQEVISFEAGEGFSIGNIDQQNGWFTTASASGNITNQVISSELSTDGSNSLKLVQETSFPPQSVRRVGAFYNYSSPVTVATTAVFSADIYINNQGESDFLFGLSDASDTWITHVIFGSLGDIIVLQGAPNPANDPVYDFTGENWSANTWYNVRIEVDNTEYKVFIDDIEISQGPSVAQGESITQVRFTHDNFDSFAYVDNFRTNAEVLSTTNVETNAFNHRFIGSTKELLLESSSVPMTEVRIFNMLGQQVLSRELSSNSERINLSSFNSGIYIAKVSLDGKTESFKFSKY